MNYSFPDATESCFFLSVLFAEINSTSLWEEKFKEGKTKIKQSLCLVSLLDKKFKSIGTGYAISEYKILTAASCVIPYLHITNYDNLKVMLSNKNSVKVYFIDVHHDCNVSIAHNIAFLTVSNLTNERYYTQKTFCLIKKKKCVQIHIIKIQM